MGKGTKDIACFPKGSKKLKKRKVEDYKINCPIVKYDPQTVRNSLAKVFTISINITFKCFYQRIGDHCCKMKIIHHLATLSEI